MKRNDRTVSRRADGRWAVKRDGASRAGSLHRTQAEAIREARRLLHASSGGELKIKGVDGRIREKDTVGRRDPFPPRG